MANRVTLERGLSESDVLRQPDPVRIADVAYHLAAYSYDATPHPTRMQELKLLRARAALRLACSVHVSGQDKGD